MDPDTYQYIVGPLTCHWLAGDRTSYCTIYQVAFVNVMSKLTIINLVRTCLI